MGPSSSTAGPAAAPPSYAGDNFDPYSDDSRSFLESESKASFASSLPTFDDFKARDEALRTPPPMDAGYRAPPTPPATPQEMVQERMMELFSFDSIDDRPKDEPEYDTTARLIGRGLPNKAGVYLLPYLQSGHMLLLGTLLLSSLVSYPGFPLTQVPDAYRTILLEGIGINYLMNAACAVYARGIAAEKEEPVNFWSAKVFLLGGLALGELSEAVPMPVKPRTGRGAGR